MSHAGASDDAGASNPERVVKTASHDQVNKPIYTKSAGRWRNYADHIDEVNEILDQVIQEFEERMARY